MYEVELKAWLKQPAKTLERIRNFQVNSEEQVVYESIYFDSEGSLGKEQKELRIRTIKSPDNNILRTELTFKDSPFDLESRSKPEIQIEIPNAEDAIELIQHLGFEIVSRLEKRCSNFSVAYRKSDLLVTIAFIPELDRTYMEVECGTVYGSKIDEQFEKINSFLAEIGINSDDLCNEYYTEMIRNKKAGEN
jgi:adenylate cyclase class 2